MRALLKKDIFVLIRQMKMFFILIIVFSAIPGLNMSMFSIVYCAMLPFTAMAYDERSKWNDLAAMMPYTTGDIVFSKYLLGWLAVGASALLNLISGFVLNSFLSEEYNVSPNGALFAFCIGTLMLSLTLPMIFRFGVEKGRLFFVLIILLLTVTGTALMSFVANSSEAVPFLSSSLFRLAIPILAAVLTAISIPLSMSFYRKHRGS